MSATDELLANNEAYAASFDKGGPPLPPGKKVAVLACMDARLNVYGALGLAEGDAHVIRNAGRVVTDDEIRQMRCVSPGRPFVLGVPPPAWRTPSCELCTSGQCRI
jgi:carbonic anhydrase